uniref:Uncharacterized protein n=1 Tax=Acrobeloides nanus TaxID=290746 RepID=A0A914C3Z4_9BILA
MERSGVVLCGVHAQLREEECPPNKQQAYIGEGWRNDRSLLIQIVSVCPCLIIHVSFSVDSHEEEAAAAER